MGRFGARPHLGDIPSDRNAAAVKRYTKPMARGWESKSVEAQQDEAAARSAPKKPRLTREAADRLREQENLRLSLRRVLQQLEQIRNPHHRAVLEQARTDLEKKLRGLST